MDVKAHPAHNHPYAKTLEKGLETQRNMYNLLKERVELITGKLPPNTPLLRLETVEAKITIIRTEGEISVLERVISEKTRYYDEYMDQFVKDEAECNEKMERLLKMAANSQKPQVRKMLDNRDLQKVLDDPEARIALYKGLKKYV